MKTTSHFSQSCQLSLVDVSEVEGCIGPSAVSLVSHDMYQLMVIIVMYQLILIVIVIVILKGIVILIVVMIVIMIVIMSCQYHVGLEAARTNMTRMNAHVQMKLFPFFDMKIRNNVHSEDDDDED